MMRFLWPGSSLALVDRSCRGEYGLATLFLLCPLLPRVLVLSLSFRSLIRVFVRFYKVCDT